MGAGGGVYQYLSDQTPQTVAQGGTSTPFVVGFKPQAAGTYTGGALVQTDLQTTPFGVGFTGSAVDSSQQTDKFIGHTPAVDILWVMDTDDDPAERVVIAQKASDFIDALNELNLDYQIGVTTSDYGTSGCASQGAGVSEQGRILPCPGCKIDGAQPTIITPQDSTAATDLQTLMEVNAGNCNWISPIKIPVPGLAGS